MPAHTDLYFGQVGVTGTASRKKIHQDSFGGKFGGQK
jgi:hypothetical protein